MPRRDGTGPLGTGPIGGGRGPCGAGFARGAGRRCRQMGNEFGRRFGEVMPAAPVKPDTAFLKQEAQSLKARLAELEKAIAETESGTQGGQAQ